MSLSPLPTDFLYSTGPQHRLQNYMQNYSGSDSGDETHESLRATSSQGDDTDSNSTSSHGDVENDQELDCLCSYKFELSAPGIKMPSLSFLIPDCQLLCNAPPPFKPSCAELTDDSLCHREGCAVLSEQVLSNEKVQEDNAWGHSQPQPPQVRRHSLWFREMLQVGQIGLVKRSFAQ